MCYVAALEYTEEPVFEGHVVHFRARCTKGHHHTISNVPSISRVGSKDGRGNSGVFELNLRSVYAHTIAGHDQTDAEMYENIMMGRHMESSQWHRLVNKVWETTILTFEESSDEVIAMIKESGEWTLVSDAGWVNRGWTAMHCSLPITWFEKQLVVHHQVLSKDVMRRGKVITKGNYQGSSGGMESEGLRRALRYLHAKGILALADDIVMDKDSSATKTVTEMKDICSHLTLRYDPGHIMKSLVGQLLKLFGEQTRYTCLAHRIGKWFMRIVKQSEKKYPTDIPKMQQEFKRLWEFTISHYSQTDCKSDCPCFFISDETVSDSIPDSGIFYDFDLKAKIKTTEGKQGEGLVPMEVEEYVEEPSLEADDEDDEDEEDKDDEEDEDDEDDELEEAEEVEEVEEVEEEAKMTDTGKVSQHSRTRKRPKVSKVGTGRVYLDFSLPEGKKLIAGLRIICDEVSNKLPNFIHGKNTCFSESMHNKRTKWTNKRKHYDKFEVCLTFEYLFNSSSSSSSSSSLLFLLLLLSSYSTYLLLLRLVLFY